MDFIIGLSRKIKQHESIMVVVDKLRNTTHFILFQSTQKVDNIMNFFMRGIVRFHNIPEPIVSSQDIRFTSYFCKNKFQALGTQIYLIIAYHP
jgi:hypothetical protein